MSSTTFTLDTFYQTDNPRAFLDLSDQGSGVMLQYLFQEASSYIEYQRVRYGLVDMLSDVGSLWSPVNLLGYFVCLSFSYNLMMSSLISKLYGFNARFP
jgi:hypothetical protein